MAIFGCFKTPGFKPFNKVIKIKRIRNSLDLRSSGIRNFDKGFAQD